MNRKLSNSAVCSLTKVSSSVLIDGEVLYHLGNFFVRSSFFVGLVCCQNWRKREKRDRTRWKSFSYFSLRFLIFFICSNTTNFLVRSSIQRFVLSGTFPGSLSRLQDDLTTIVVKQKLSLHFCLTFNAISSFLVCLHHRFTDSLSAMRAELSFWNFKLKVFLFVIFFFPWFQALKSLKGMTKWKMTRRNLRFFAVEELNFFHMSFIITQPTTWICERWTDERQRWCLMRETSEKGWQANFSYPQRRCWRKRRNRHVSQAAKHGGRWKWKERWSQLRINWMCL